MSKYQRQEIDEILQEMRSDYWRTLEESEESNVSAGAEFLTIRSSGIRYGLLASFCREVLKVPEIVRVPRLPEHLRGIFNLRGEIVAVTDLGPLIGQNLQKVHENCRLVIVSAGAMKTALLVEVVEGLVHVEDDEIESLAEGAGAGARDLISGKVVRGEYVLILLDVEKLLARPELIVDHKGQETAE
jgi:purine-binding chemotaxis protein CheW